MSLPESPWRLERRPDASMLPRMRVADVNDRTVCLVPCHDSRLRDDESEAVGKVIVRLPFLLDAIKAHLSELDRYLLDSSGDVRDLMESADVLRAEYDAALRQNVRV